jgi:hypothetical protein
MKLSEINWSVVLKNVGGVVTTFNPAIGSGLVVASEVVDKLNGDSMLSDNEVLKNNVVGLSACADILTDYLQKVELNQAPTTDNLKVVLVSIQSLDTLLDKNYAIMK